MKALDNTIVYNVIGWENFDERLDNWRAHALYHEDPQKYYHTRLTTRRLANLPAINVSVAPSLRGPIIVYDDIFHRNFMVPYSAARTKKSTPQQLH